MRFLAFSILFLVTPALADHIKIDPPKGFVQFCKDHDCTKRGSENPHNVHIDVNQKIKQQADLWERWDLMPYYGDCDDYAISKWYRSDRFDLAIVCIGDQLHLVATLDGMIYDNLTNKPRPIKDEVLFSFSKGLEWFTG